jgi:hypothetical protein
LYIPKALQQQKKKMLKKTCEEKKCHMVSTTLGNFSSKLLYDGYWISTKALGPGLRVMFVARARTCEASATWDPHGRSFTGSCPG